MIEISPIDPPEGSKEYAETTSTLTFYHTLNGSPADFNDYVRFVSECRAKFWKYKPVIHEFPRDGDQLVGRMTGTMEIDGVKSKFESFMFAQIEEATGRMIL